MKPLSTSIYSLQNGNCCIATVSLVECSFFVHSLYLFSSAAAAAVRNLTEVVRLLEEEDRV